MRSKQLKRPHTCIDLSSIARDINFDGQSLFTSIRCVCEQQESVETLCMRVRACVCGYIWTTVRDLGTYRTWAKICFKDCICLVGRMCVGVRNSMFCI